MNEYLVKYARTGVGILLTQMTTPEIKKVEFIDPLCSIIKLGLVASKSEGIKLSIQSNTIEFHEPWLLQGLHRWLREDKKEQLIQLRMPLLYFRGLVLNHIQNQFNRDELEYFNRQSIQGLKKLKLTYEDDQTCLDDHIRILTTHYDHEEYFQMLEKSSAYVMFAIYNEFIKLWDNHDISIILTLFKLAEKEPICKLRHQWANCIEQYVKVKDMKLDALRPHASINKT